MRFPSPTNVGSILAKAPTLGLDNVAGQGLAEDAKDAAMFADSTAKNFGAGMSGARLIGAAEARADAQVSAANSTANAQVANAAMGVGSKLIGGAFSGGFGGGAGSGVSSAGAESIGSAAGSFDFSDFNTDFSAPGAFNIGRFA